MAAAVGRQGSFGSPLDDGVDGDDIELDLDFGDLSGPAGVGAPRPQQAATAAPADAGLGRAAAYAAAPRVSPPAAAKQNFGDLTGTGHDSDDSGEIEFSFSDDEGSGGPPKTAARPAAAPGAAEGASAPLPAPAASAVRTLAPLAQARPTVTAARAHEGVTSEWPTAPAEDDPFTAAPRVEPPKKLPIPRPTAGVDELDLVVPALPVASSAARPAASREEDDEFEYAFEGKKREAPTFAPVFKPAPMPLRLMTDLRSKLDALNEDETEETEDSPTLAKPATEETSTVAETVVPVVFDNMSAQRPTTGRTRLPPPPLVAMGLKRGAGSGAAAGAGAEAAPASSVDKSVSQQDASSAPPVAREHLESEWEAVTALRLTEKEASPQAWAASVAQAASPQPAPAPPKPTTAVPVGPSISTDSSAPSPASPAAAPELLLLPYADAWAFFTAVGIPDSLRGSLVVEETSNGSSMLGGLWSLCFGPPQLRGPLAAERDLLFAVAKTPFSDAQPIHVRLLNTVFGRYHGPLPGHVPPARYGPHWEAIGFQGTDPVTDLRGGGMLGLLQMLALWTHDADNAAALFALSRDAVQGFPLAPLAINVTKWTLDVLRRGQLNGEAVGADSVAAAANSFYVGTWYEFYRRWLSGRKTMRESGYVNRELETYVKAHVPAVLAGAKLKLPAMSAGPPVESFSRLP